MTDLPTSPLHLPAWSQLAALARAPQPHLREVLHADSLRAPRMTHTAAGITLDASRQRVSPAVETALSTWPNKPTWARSARPRGVR